MARLWRERWVSGREKDIAVLNCLKDAERSGAPATFELEQIMHLFAIAYPSHINSDRLSNNHITRRSLVAKSKTAIALNNVKKMLDL